jgi:hypothetical protein
MHFSSWNWIETWDQLHILANLSCSVEDLVPDKTGGLHSQYGQSGEDKIPAPLTTQTQLLSL